VKNKDVDALELWNKEEEKEFTRRADRFWGSLTGEHEKGPKKDEARPEGRVRL